MEIINLIMRANERYAFYSDVVGNPTNVVVWGTDINQNVGYVPGDRMALTPDVTIAYAPVPMAATRNTQVIIEHNYYVDGDVFSKGKIVNFKIIGLDEIAKTIFGTSLADVLKGSGMSDTIKGGIGNDTIYGYGNYDLLYGGAGNDKLFGGDSTDRLYGDSGNDKLAGEKGDDFLKGGSGNDTLDGGVGNDFMEGGTGNDRVIGGTGNNFLSGEAGRDNLNGGAGNDRIYGGLGADILTGGSGKDVFIIRSAKDSTVAASGRDVIVDFNTRDDLIDIRGVDANTKKGYDQNFDTYLGTKEFTKKVGEIRYEKSGGDTYVYGDTNGDGKADFSIKLEGLHTLTKGDFLL